MELNGKSEGSVTQNGTKTLSNTESNEAPKVPYPKRIFFIVGNEFCERFNYHGIKTILALYLKNKLGYSENDATALYHGFTMMVYFMSLFGGILSDVWLGKFKTILYLSIVYSIGSVTVSISSIPTINLSPQISLMVGLVLIAMGSGGIKPCVTAFGGDQFKLPEQAAQMAAYFSLFYFTINSGALMSSTLTPIFREDVHCFGEMDCFSLAFGVPAILMLISIVFLLIGKSSYTYVKTTSENMLVQVLKCISHAISTKFRERREKPRKNLLDYSIDKYGEQLVNETRVLFRILVLFLPLPLFWTLFDQQGSRWTFQANKMDGDIGFYTIKPDQIQVLNPFLVLILIPIFETVIYPILKRIGIRRPLQKLTMGGLFAALAFLFSALVQFKIEYSTEKSVNMLWLVPQYLVMAMAEATFAVTGLAFSYEQAPKRMKSVVIAFWQLNIAFGNLILIPIADLAFFDSQAHEFLLFSGLMFVDMLIFMALAHNYESITQNAVESKEKHKLELGVPVKRLEEMTPL